MASVRSRSPPEVTKGKLPSQWIGTWNNYVAGDAERFSNWCELNCQYSIGGYEIGKQGTPHIQSFHQMKRRCNFAAFKLLFPSVRVTPITYGFSHDPASYCCKDGKPAFETGAFVEKNPGARTDLHKAAAHALSGASLREIAMIDPGAVAMAPSGLGRLVTMFEKPRDRRIPLVCVCLWGQTDCHKTRRIYDHIESLGEELFHWSPMQGPWFDGYMGQSHVLMDEYRGQLPLGALLSITQRYPTRVPVKGGFVQWKPNFIYFTSPKPLRKWYTADDEYDLIAQLVRRFQHEWHVTSPGQEVPLSIIGDLPTKPST